MPETAKLQIEKIVTDVLGTIERGRTKDYTLRSVLFGEKDAIKSSLGLISKYKSPGAAAFL